MVENLLLFGVCAFLLNPVFPQFDEFFYEKFNGADTTTNLSLDGNAKIENNGMIELTNDNSRLLGHAFHSFPLRFKNSTDGKVFSFSTAFAFAIVPQHLRLGGHGIAFAISSTKELTGAFPSQYLGLLNSSDNGNFSNHVFAVEFDTVQDFELEDINDNHIGVNINSMKSKDSVPAACVNSNLTKEHVDLHSGKTILAWIDYNAASCQLNVTISPHSKKPRLSILSFHVDLSPILKEFMFVGFSASTGLLASSHYVFGWSFKMNGEAKSLYHYSSLPILPLAKKSGSGLIIGVSVSAAAAVVVAVVGISMIVYFIKKVDGIEDWEVDIGPHRFSYKELKQATKGFKDKGLLGFGGFGRVYKGTIPNSETEVAVKRIGHGSKQGLHEFVSEIATIGRLRHRNLVQLLGWCRRRGDLLLVYDFMPNGSLDKYLYDEPKSVLTWEQRFKIIKCVASGLLYLHEEWEQVVIHRDIKAANVLLDSELNGRLGDFGLAKLYEHGSHPTTTKVVGTLGYLAPELTRTGKPTASSDVFAFGALLLEVVCGRRPIEHKALPEEMILVDWVWDKWRDGGIFDVVDKRLNGKYDEVQVVIVIKLGIMCSNSSPNARPTMRQVVRYLEGEVELPKGLKPPDAHKGMGCVEADDYDDSRAKVSFF